MILELKNLAIGYEKKTIFSDIRAEADRGELICLIGANGKGKSTLLKTIAGLLKIKQGEISVNGRSLSGLKRKDLSQEITYVPSNTPRVDNLKVRELIALNCYHTANWLGVTDRETDLRIEKAIQKVGLDGFGDRNSAELSDGEYQRCMIAGSLAKSADLILLDEPTAFLDIAGKFAVYHLLKSIARDENKAIIFSSHDLQMAIETCDRIWLMGNNGFHEGTPDELIEKNIFAEIFNDDNLIFDTERRIFTYRK